MRPCLLVSPPANCKNISCSAITFCPTASKTDLFRSKTFLLLGKQIVFVYDCLPVWLLVKLENTNVPNTDVEPHVCQTMLANIARTSGKYWKTERKLQKMSILEKFQKNPMFEGVTEKLQIVRKRFFEKFHRLLGVFQKNCRQVLKIFSASHQVIIQHRLQIFRKNILHCK